MEQLLLQRVAGLDTPNSFHTFSVKGNETLDINPEENFTIFINFNPTGEIISTFSDLNITINNSTFATDQKFTSTSTQNFSGFYWILNKTMCPGLIYSISTEQYIFSERSIIRTSPENVGMCMFYNQLNYSGNLLATAFGNKFKTEIYSYDDNSSLSLLTSCFNKKCDKTSVVNPFFMRLNIESDESYFFYSLDLGSERKSSCSETPIRRITKDGDITQSQRYVKASNFCTNHEGFITGLLIILLVILGIIIIGIALIVAKKIDTINSEKYEKFD